MVTKPINPIQIHRPALGGVVIAALIGIVLVPAASAGVVTSTFTIQKGNMLQDGATSPYARGSGYTNAVDGRITDNSATAGLSTGPTAVFGNQFQAAATNGPNSVSGGQQHVGLFSYDLTDLNNFIAASTGPNRTASIAAVSFTIISAGGNSTTGGNMSLALYGTDPFTSAANWSTTDGSTPWTVPYQNPGAPTNTLPYAYTGGGSHLTPSLGTNSIFCNTASAGAPMTWIGGTNFISAVTDALARADKTLYLTASGTYFNNGDSRLNVIYSPTNTATLRPQLQIAVDVTTTAVSPSALKPRVNLAKYQAVKASTTNAQYLPGFVADGLVNNNSWCTLNVSTPHWAEIDFPLPVTIASAHVYHGVDDGSLLANFKFQYKSGASWIDVPGSTRSGNTASEVNVIFSSAVTSDSFRLYSDDNNTQRVKEIALFPPNLTNGVEQGYPIGTDVELNLAKKRPAVATAFSGTNYPKLAVDGFADSTSKWQTTLVGSNALQIDLRIGAKIGSAHLYSGDGAVPPITNFVLQYWDGSAWQAIPGGAVSGNTNPACVITFTTPVTTTNVQLVFTNSSVSAVRELCLFPANGGVGYPLGQDVVSAPPPNLDWEDYNDAFYNVINRAANLSASVVAGTPCLGATNLDGALGQYQILFNVGTDTYRLRHRATGQCLAGAGLSTNAGALLVNQDYTALPHQNWRFMRVDGTDFHLVNQWSGLVIDTQGGGTNATTPLVQNAYTGETSQRWHFVLSTNYPKKGLAGYVDKWSEFKGNWAYNWGRTTTVNLPAQVVFNPMQWGNFNWDITSGSGTVEQFLSAWQREDKAMYQLGFNEPDGTDQSNITVDKAIELWPRLERMDQPLISPVTTNPDNSWMTNFMAQANARGYRMDAVAAHKYPGPNGGDPSALISELQSLSVKWGRPVWFTEFSTVDWSTNSSATWTQEDNYNWLAEFMWRAESLQWLRRYSLFLFTANTTNYAEPTNPWDPVGPRSNAFDTNGAPTSFGELYFAWDGDANVRGDKAYFIHNRAERKRLRNAVSSSAPSHGNIREGTNTTQWVLRAAPTAGQWYLTSLRDGRRLRNTSGVLDFAPANTTGTNVTWTLVENQYGWFYVENPAAPTTSRRLKDAAGVFSMASTTNNLDQVKWRFIPPYADAPTAPASPTNLSATSGTNQISLTWSSGGASSIAYSVFRSSTAGGGYSLIASNLALPSFVDVTAVAGNTYFYVTTAWDVTGGQSPYSNEDSAMAVSPLPTAPTNISFAVSNSTLVLNWPSNYTGWLLQAQTNPLASGLATNWITLPGSDTNSTFLAPVNPANPTVFFRLKRP